MSQSAPAAFRHEPRLRQRYDFDAIDKSYRRPCRRRQHDADYAASAAAIAI